MRNKEAEARQEDAILEFFRLNPLGWTPEEIHQHVFDRRCPLTSVRRGISNLTAQGKLVKTDDTRMGYYGHQSHVWKLAGKPAQMELV